MGMNHVSNEPWTSRVPKVPVFESYLHVCSGLQQVLLHVVPEVVQQLHLHLSHDHQIQIHISMKPYDFITFFSTVAGNSFSV